MLMDGSDSGLSPTGASARISDLSLLGGRLCLDFANTLDWRASEHPLEYLTSYAALATWGEHAGALSAAAAEQLRTAAERRPEEATTTLRDALALREAIWRIFVALAHSERPPAGDLERLNVMLGEALRHAQIAPAAGATSPYMWDWEERGDALGRPLWPVVRSAADLLTSDDAGRAQECLGDGCGWLFLDTSKNHSRRWCAMRGCGNRAKARRHYQRAHVGKWAKEL
jgi:predicted RNA-binding Zn ribbon-like protein